MNLFPSPIGELHFSIIMAHNGTLFRMWFPSPIGELHFSIFVSNLYDISQPIVSVPYRGATFLNYYMYISSICKHLFPSPIGELHFSIIIQNPSEESWKISFRPLSGSYISQ